jgi:hypothetical protein
MREGIAAEIARRGADVARDPALARVLRIQARDERQHAALGWAIVEWCIERGGEPIRAALLAALPEATLPRCDDLPEHGRIGARTMAPVFEELRAAARARLTGAAVRAAA